ncbi:MAG: Gfo/Idh/MocA family oxidoreductase [Bacteroidota bacterium]
MNIGIIGTQFMGKAHANAYNQLPHFFETTARPVLHTACSRNHEKAAEFSEQFGWSNTETDWRNVISNDEIDLIDICTPNHLHQPIVMEASRQGKNLLCEKPMALNTNEAREMYEAAEIAGIVHMMIFNYRYVPALALAKKMISDGDIGKVYHFNAVYYQDWLTDPNFPYVWRHNVKETGSGAHGDMNAHIVDLARHLIGEFEAVTGVQEVFIKERPTGNGMEKAPVSADDATLFLARFRQGALGTFNATRFANGFKNHLRIEIFGSEGSLIFNLERLNELQYFSAKDDTDKQGFRNILVTNKSHPFLKAWWPPGHILGWEHTFIHQFSELIYGIAQKNQVTPNFYDGLRCQEVLDGVVASAQKEKWIAIAADA